MKSRSLSRTDTPEAERGLKLSNEAERDILATEAAAFARALSDPTAQARYLRLASSAAEGIVPDELVASVETMLELLFEKGRPSNPAVLQAIFAATPRGRQRTAAAREVSHALQTLRGQRLEDLRLTAGPSGYTLLLETDRCRLTLELDNRGARVATLEAG